MSNARHPANPTPTQPAPMPPALISIKANSVTTIDTQMEDGRPALILVLSNGLTETMVRLEPEAIRQLREKLESISALAVVKSMPGL